MLTLAHVVRYSLHMMTQAEQEATEAWWAHCEQQYRQAEEATCGNLIRKDRWHEFMERYGAHAVQRIMFEGGPAAVAYRYASEELVHWWNYNPRMTANEFLYLAGIRTRTYRKCAIAAQSARETAHRRALESLEAARRI